MHAPVDATAVRAALAEVPDPELPVVSVVDLGMVHRVAVDEDVIRVELLPTFVGCPALDAIRLAVETRLAAFGCPVEVAFTLLRRDDRPDLRRRPAAQGRRDRPPLPATGSVVRGAAPQTSRRQPVRPNPCRSVYYCRSCRQPFEGFSPWGPDDLSRRVSSVDGTWRRCIRPHSLYARSGRSPDSESGDAGRTLAHGVSA
jgi:ring-1,2-phenylacetyl-CoA epoxidase subunit PaaD